MGTGGAAEGRFGGAERGGEHRPEAECGQVGHLPGVDRHRERLPAGRQLGGDHRGEQLGEQAEPVRPLPVVGEHHQHPLRTGTAQHRDQLRGGRQDRPQRRPGRVLRRRVGRQAEFAGHHPVQVRGQTAGVRRHPHRRRGDLLRPVVTGPGTPDLAVLQPDQEQSGG